MSTMANFRKKLLSLVGLPCLGAIAGAGTGTVFTLDIGRPIPRSRPVKNKHVPELLRLYEGEYYFYVQCAWRLESSDEVICGSLNDNRAGGPMVTGLARVAGSTIIGVQEPETPGLDLVLKLDTGLILRVFCDQVQTGEADNYCLFTPAEVFVVGPSGALSVEPRT